MTQFPEMNTFSSVIRFGLTFEEAAQQFYAGAAELAPDQAELLNSLAESHQKRYALLEETRQQKLNEMILEPVSGVEREDYLPDVELADKAELAAKAKALEELGAKFYDDLAVVAKELSREASRVYARMAKENGKLLKKLAALD